MIYTDPDGNFWNFVIGGVLGGISGWQIGKAQGAKGWGMFGYIAGGAAIGVVTAGLAEGVAGAFVSSNTVGASMGAYATAGAVAGSFSGAGFAALSGNTIGKGALIGGLIGGLGGAVSGYLQYNQIGVSMERSMANRSQWMACKDCAWTVNKPEVVVKRGMLDYGSPLYDALVAINDFNPLAIAVNSMYGYLYGRDTAGRPLSGMEATANLLSLAVPGGRGAGIAAKGVTQAEYTFTKTAAKHLTEVVKRGENAGQLARPYMNSPLTIQEIMSTSKGTLDATFKGGMNWRVPGTFRGSQGIWELGINPKTNVIYHFNFTHP